MKNYKNIIAVLLLIFFSVQLQAEGDKKNKQNNFYKTNGLPNYTKFNINNISTWFFNNGGSDLNLNGNSGFIYPKGTYNAVFYESGLLFGGKVDGKIKVGGSTYRHGQVPGKILQNGMAEDPNLPNVRIYKVRRDYKTSDLVEDIEYRFEYKYIDGKSVFIKKEQITDLAEVRNQYSKDWYEWPANDGAPFEDIDFDGIFNPDIDIPGVPGADQTIWFVANDLDPVQTKFLYGSEPIGIEMQATVWGYKNLDLYEDILFRKYILINKSGKTIEDMYITMWSDPDLGDATDDYVGCDTVLNLGYVYNGDTNDATYGTSIPAGGFILLQGPLVDGNPSDKGYKLNRIYNNKKNMDMSSFVFYIGSDPVYSDPNLGEYDEGTLENYNLMQGRVGITGDPFIAPEKAGGGITKFLLSGDPVNRKGWIDGMIHPPGDRRFLMNTGPFEMADGDTQEVIYGQLAAGAYYDNLDNISSVVLLKLSALAIKNAWTRDKIYSYRTLPKLKGKAFDNKIVLDWSLGGDSLNIIENYTGGIYRFEGYNIYQLPKINSPVSEYHRIGTFDKINGVSTIVERKLNRKTATEETAAAQFGNDTGLQRYLEIEKDFINNKPLHNGSPYYYVISAYHYNDINYSFLNHDEVYSDPIKVIPQNPNPGIRYESETGDSISISHLRGTAEADVNIIVVDPSEVNGHQYEISFKKISENKIVWDLDDVTENITVLSNQKNITGTDEYLIIDGIRIIITQNENNILTENDLYRFITPKVNYNEEVAKTDVENINVFPNPYYGYNPMETQKLGNFVMINHLPKRATIRIFNLAGQLVRTLHKESEDQFYLWDLQNEHQLYILHIEMPDLGKVKVLKLAVVLGTEVPDFY